jgi:hypothetical protein
MKNQIIPFLVGGLIFISIAASTSNFMVVQPAKPTVTVVQSFRTIYGLEKDIKNYIDAMVKQGYIVKEVVMMDDENWSKGIVVMEKY